MKRICLPLLAVFLLLSLLPFGVFASDAPATPTVYVTIVKDVEETLEYNPFATERLAVAVTDADSDGALTVNDALILAHAQYEGGAEAGYASVLQDGIPAVSKLWGTVDAAYGIFLNHNKATPATEIQNGDNLCAYVSVPDRQEIYAFFDADTLTVEQDKTATLTLKVCVQTGESVIVTPLADAWIYVDGSVTEFKTDDEGKVTVTLPRVGVSTVSAMIGSRAIVPPICKVTVTEKVTTNDGSSENSGTTGPIEFPEIKLEGDVPSDQGCQKIIWGSVIAGAAVAAGVAVFFVLRSKKKKSVQKS